MTVREALQRLAHNGPPHLRDELTAYAVSRGATYRTLLPILGLRSTGSITQRLARRKVVREPILDDPCPVHLRPVPPQALDPLEAATVRERIAGAVARIKEDDHA